MARTKVGDTIISANWLNICHGTFAASVAGCREIHLERLHVMWRAVIVGHRCACHFEIITSEEEEQRIAGETDDIRYEDKLDSAFRL